MIAASIVLLVAQALTPYQRSACAPYLSAPGADPAVLNNCLENARRAEAQADFLRRSALIGNEIDSLTCPCAEAGVSFSLADVAMASPCRGALVGLKIQELSTSLGLSLDSTALPAVTKKFEECVLDLRGKGPPKELSPAQKWHESEMRRREAEAKQEEAEEEDAQRRAAADPRKILSLQMCYVTASRKHAKQMIANEKEGARAGLGVIDKEEVYKWQGELVIIARLEKLVKADLKARRLSLAACAPADAQRFSECIDGMRSQPLEVGANEDEYLTSALRIREFSPGCL